MDLSVIVDKLLDMSPDPIPYFVLLKEFKGLSPDNAEYQNAYDRVCEHPFIERFVESQNEKGFWPSYHVYTEWVIRRLLSFGLEKNHASLKKALEYSERLLNGEEEHDRAEKQDDSRWWPKMFMPLVLAATISIIDSTNKNIAAHRKRWTHITETAFAGGSYDEEADRKTQSVCFGLNTKHTIHPFNYYSCLLLSPRNGEKHLCDSADQALVDYGMKQAA